MMITLKLPEVEQYLLEHDNYYILTHRRPDGDAVGCAAALCLGLRSIGKNAWVFENPQITEKFRPYVDGMIAEEIPDNGNIISVDLATLGLLPYSLDVLPRQTELLIDHHESNEKYAVRGYVDSKAAACGEIILQILEDMNVSVTERMANALYVAISTDTGCFRYSNVTDKTFLSAAKCKKYGADTYAINNVMFMTKRIQRLKLESYLTENTEFYANGLVAISCLSDDVCAQMDLNEDDLDDISGFGRQICGVEIGVMIRDEKDRGKVSLRTSPNYNACAICAHLGGGGHAAASGASVQGGIEAAKKAIMEAIELETGVILNG